MAISMKTKEIAQEIREDMKNKGYSNRDVSINCKYHSKKNGKPIETINIVVYGNSVNERDTKWAYNFFKSKYENEYLNFMYYSKNVLA